MAKPVIPTNFQDDVLSENMNDRRQYQMINNPNGTVSFIDVTQYDQIGDSFGQARVNNMATAINESVDKATVIDDIDDIVANTQPNMPAGALAVAQLYGNTTVRYNAETHYIQISVDGEWINYRYFNPQEPVALVPTMMSNTTPYGECSASSVYNFNEPYKAFDNNESTFYASNPTGGRQYNWITYKFDNLVTITHLAVKPKRYLDSIVYGDAKILTSADGTTWTEIGEMQLDNTDNTQYYTFATPVENVLYVKFYIYDNNTNPTKWGTGINSLQYYGFN